MLLNLRQQNQTKLSTTTKPIRINISAMKCITFLVILNVFFSSQVEMMAIKAAGSSSSPMNDTTLSASARRYIDELMHLMKKSKNNYM